MTSIICIKLSNNSIIIGDLSKETDEKMTLNNSFMVNVEIESGKAKISMAPSEVLSEGFDSRDGSNISLYKSNIILTFNPRADLYSLYTKIKSSIIVPDKGSSPGSGIIGSVSRIN